MSDPHCNFELLPHPWPWPLIFKVKFWKCCISGMGGPIDMERKGRESIGCETHIVTLNCDLTHDLDPWISRSNFEKGVTQQWDVRWNGRDVSQLNVGAMLWLSTLTSPMSWTLNFQRQILKLLYPRNGRVDRHGTKGIWVDRVLYLLCDLELWPWPWIFKVKF